MKDILEELRKLIGDHTATDSSSTSVTFALLCRAADEIAWLRSVAGAVSREPEADEAA